MTKDLTIKCVGNAPEILYSGEYVVRDLTIKCVGNTREMGYDKIQHELDWFRERFPSRKYPKKFRKSSVDLRAFSA